VASMSGKKYACTVLYCSFLALRYVKTLDTTITKTRSNAQFYNYVKGKAIPLQTWTGPEGSSRLRHPDFKTIGA